ncbi:uncharacterized protein EDB93DRAFT_1254813 [Suillus bovinus]|uniref:uncharacterized protein n=1 Tax=Suillus bovinus TaxID=48563 RepID=UPI001B871941|nr:uncharacterized protein EDB93DRAFT_1254813 [Suillus bovinus]KAG2133602.1 hypothetical protein EDB93DRAFT_1254813 [Suillus bovinus]
MSPYFTSISLNQNYSVQISPLSHISNDTAISSACTMHTKSILSSTLPYLQQHSHLLCPHHAHQIHTQLRSPISPIGLKTRASQVTSSDKLSQLQNKLTQGLELAKTLLSRENLKRDYTQQTQVSLVGH